MNSEIFIDTSGFFSLLSSRDDAHKQARDILAKAKKSNGIFVTTDYIIDETATLLNARGIGSLATVLFDTIRTSSVCRIEWMDDERFFKTQAYFEKHLDHAWSFTDCFSFLIMKELKLKSALTKDKHFTQAGFVPLLISK